MPIELKSKKGVFYFSNHDWEETLILAKEGGWIPLDAPTANWEPLYFSSNGDIISKQDALNLGTSLQGMLSTCSLNKREHLKAFIKFCYEGEFVVE